MGRFVVLALFVASVTSAHASFELLLVADNGAETFATRKVHRFEARTGTYLGSFGGFSTNIASSWLRQSTSSMFILEAGSITEWDYNTGALKNTYASIVGFHRTSVRPDGQKVAIFDGFSDFLTRDFPNTFSGGIAVGVVPTAVFRSGLWFEQNQVMAFDAGNRVFRRFQMNAAGTAGSQTANSIALATPSFGQMARNAGTNQLVMAGGNIKLVDSNTMLVGEFASPFGVSTAAAAAHHGFFVAGANGSSGLITYYDNLTNIRAQFGGSVLVNPVAMETVLAPEPGTMLALGTGLAAILRRRRSR